MSLARLQYSPAVVPGSDSELFRRIVEDHPFGLVVCHGGDIRIANRKALRMLGAHAADELLGREFIRFVQPYDQKAVISLLIRDLDGGVQEGDAKVRLIRRNGTEVVSELHISHLDHGDVQIVLREIDEHQIAVETLRQSEQQYRALVEDAPDGVLIMAVDGEVLFANSGACEILGRTGRLSTVGHDYATTFCTEPQHRELLVQALHRQGFIRNFEYEIRRPTGQRRTVLENARLVRDQQGTPLYCRSYIRDITEWKQLEHQLFQSQKMESMTALVGGIGHDFINVLNNMRGFAGQLKSHFADAARVQKYADTLEKSADRGLGLANKLLGLSRKRKVTPSSSSVQEVIAEIIEIASESFRPNIIIETDIQKDLPLAAVDSGELYQAVMNICLNAQDAMPDGGTLHISAQFCSSAEEEPMLSTPDKHDEQYVRISISDTGTGIPAGLKDRIFDPFFTTKDRGKGTGLGLSVVYGTVQNYRGTIVVESEEQKGSTFTMFFPVAESENAPSGASALYVGRNNKDTLILLVDDEIMMQELGRELLEEQGYRVMIARDGVEAVELYRKHVNDISLVILDLLMPRLDGGQAYLELKKINDNVRAFFCTGFTPQDIVGPIMEGASLRALQKPFRPAEFLATVREMLAA